MIGFSWCMMVSSGKSFSFVVVEYFCYIHNPGRGWEAECQKPGGILSEMILVLTENGGRVFL
jgi:hypothetical protein